MIKRGKVSNRLEIRDLFILKTIFLCQLLNKQAAVQLKETETFEELELSLMAFV